jgi:hypothetical protein
MKSLRIIILLCLALTSYLAQAQNPLSQRVQTELSMGISLPFLEKGEELMRAKRLRDQGLSYYQAPEGESPRQVGNYSAPIGWSLALGYYHPISRIKGLMLGGIVRSSLTGSTPSEGGYEEGYFFNFLSVGGGLKYYPFTQNNFFVKADAGLASVFTKNRFLDESGEQAFFHQFGIGFNSSVAVGYSLKPFPNKSTLLDLQVIAQRNNTRVEVNGIGNDIWRYTALNFMLSLNF